MESDRQLLEDAARAAGIELHHWSHAIGCFMYSEHGGDPLGSWNPLTDDGDALRLAVKLKLMISPSDCAITDGVHLQAAHHPVVVVELSGDDEYAALRRAIVRAAAQIGRGKTQC